MVSTMDQSITSIPPPVVNVYESKEEGNQEFFFSRFILKANGTALRYQTVRLPASPDFRNGVASKDTIVDRKTGLWARIFVPETIEATHKTTKLPVVVYFHAGGFCMGDAGDSISVSNCERICREANVVVVSASYRLAPENRLPAAYDDGYTTLLWLQKQCKNQGQNADKLAGDGHESLPWLNNYVDFSQVFLMGMSSGGNLAHHLLLLKPITELNPLSIKGLILLVPAFGAEEPTDSEKLYADNPVLPEYQSHALWRAVLPLGSNLDHPFYNFASPDVPYNLAEVQLFPKVLVVVAGQDTLYTGDVAYANLLKKAGKNVKLVEVPAGDHMFRVDPQLAAENVRVDKAISEFINL